MPKYYYRTMSTKDRPEDFQCVGEHDELVRLAHAFRDGGFQLTLWDTHRTDWRGQTVIGYSFEHGGRVVFQGEDFAGSPMHADDSDETMACLLSFLSLRPGDTDAEYFEGYSADQMDWAMEYGEELALLAEEMRQTHDHGED